MRRWLSAGLLVALLCAAGWFLFRTEPRQASPAAATGPTVSFGSVSLRVELATTPAEREKGLGGRTSMPEDSGMLFVFPKDDLYGFWMKDTLIPLDMFWLDSKGQVVSIAQDVATSSFPHVFYPSAPALYVLETRAGFARDHGVRAGMRFSLKNIPIVSE